MKKTIYIILLCLLLLNLSGCTHIASNDTAPSDSSIYTTQYSLETNIAGSSDSSQDTTQSVLPFDSYDNESFSAVDVTTSGVESATIDLIATDSTSATPIQSSDFVANLNISQNYSQIIVVSANGINATVSMHETDVNGIWSEIMSTSGYVGKNGVGKASESDTKTPAGIYGLSIAFGIQPDPGTALQPYRQVTDSDYWVDDVKSAFYNQFVSTKTVIPDWTSAEHIIDLAYTTPYAYCIAIDYNLARVPGDGSAIFLHCSTGNATAGCVSVPTNKMIYILTHIKPGCVILIDVESNINATHY